MCTELCCVPYVKVFGVLCEALICSLFVIYEYNWVFLSRVVFGIVILLKPVVPLSPVIVKNTVVERADWFVDILALDI